MLDKDGAQRAIELYKIIDEGDRQFRTILEAQAFDVSAPYTKDMFFPAMHSVTSPKMVDVIKTHVIDSLIAIRQNFVNELVDLGFKSPGEIRRNADGMVMFENAEAYPFEAV